MIDARTHPSLPPGIHTRHDPTWSLWLAGWPIRVTRVPKSRLVDSREIGEEEEKHTVRGNSKEVASGKDNP